MLDEFFVHLQSFYTRSHGVGRLRSHWRGHYKCVRIVILRNEILPWIRSVQKFGALFWRLVAGEEICLLINLT